jgi:hypothetical protein
MNTNKHTPGPFTYHPERAVHIGMSRVEIPIHAGNPCVAVAAGPTLDKALANAALFASAPALLAALREPLSRAKVGEPLILTPAEIDAAREALQQAQV